MCTDRPIDNINKIHTKEYCSSFKKKKILPSTTKWVNLKCNILSKRGQTQKKLLGFTTYIPYVLYIKRMSNS